MSFPQVNYWATWPAAIATFADLDVHLAAARAQVAANPSLILVGMLEIAASLGLIDQLDWAIARMIGIISGPLIPLAAAAVNSFYVASTVFGEMGNLLVTPLSALPMQLKKTDMSRPMRGGSVIERDISATLDAPIAPVMSPASEESARASIGVVIATMSMNMNVATDMVTALNVGGAFTYAAWCVVMSVSGVEWQHIREVYGAMPAINNMHLKRQMLEASIGIDGQGASWITRATVTATSKLANANWPRASLPSMQQAFEYGVPPGVIARLGITDTTFSGCDHLRVFIPLLTEVPSIFPLSRSSVVGSLAGTLTWEEEVAGTFQFRLRNMRPKAAWTEILINDHSNLDLAVVGELNVLVSAGFRAMRYM